LERSVKVEEAINIAEKNLDWLGIKFNFSKKSEGDYSTYIFDGKAKSRNNEIVNIKSCGKGIGLQSKASGLFELLEHYLSENCSINLIDSKEKVSDVNLFSFEKEYPICYLKSNFTSESLDFFRFSQLTNENNQCYYPCFLTNPKFIKENLPFKKLFEYSTNSGTSTGIGFKETIIHSVSEILERHSVSLHLFENFFTKTQRGFWNILIDQKTISSSNKKILDSVKRLSKNLVYIFDLSKYIPFSSYMVVTKNSKSKRPFIGSGASVFPEYALERALLECLQSIHAYELNEEKEDYFNWLLLKDFPLIKNTYSLSYDPITFKTVKQKEILCNFNDVNETYNEIVDLCEKYQLKIFYRIIYKRENFYCTQVIIPELSKLNLILNGNILLPQPTEVALWQRTIK
jgi:hypothetical protein